MSGGGRDADQSPRMPPGWWLIPGFALGACAWLALIRAALALITGGHHG